MEYDGKTWEIVEIEPPSVLLADRSGTAIRQVSLGHLLSSPQARLLVEGVGEPPEGIGVELSNLAGGNLDAVRARIEHVQEVRTGYRLGHEVLARPGEPREPYAPGAPKLERYAAKAAELGVGVSTIRRWIADFDRDGPEALIDERTQRRRDPLGGADPLWLDMARTVLAEHADASRPTQNIVLLRIRARLDSEHGHGVVANPSPTRARLLLRELSRGSHAFGGTKTKRSTASRPAAPYGRLRASRPGEYVLLDTTSLDVFAMDPITLRWVKAELTIAMDLYDRCITGLRLTPVSTKAVDAAGVLFETVRPLPDTVRNGITYAQTYHGLPRGIVVDADKLVDADGAPLLPSVAAETIVVDHGKIYLSEQLLSACQRLGISVQPARPYQGSDKAALERFFRTLREGLLVGLPGYKGPDVYSRGLAVEQQAFYFLDELEAQIRQWIAEVYHREAHDGLCIPEVPGLHLSPLDMYGHGVSRAGYLQIPARPDLAFDFLKVEWRTVQHYGIEYGGLRYNGPVLADLADTTSPYTGRHSGKWPFRVDAGDVSRLYFQHPRTRGWHALRWEHAEACRGPFSAEALAYARRLAAAKHRFPDTKRALIDLLEQWDAGLTHNPAERRMAVRLSHQRLRLVPADALVDDEPLPSIPSTLARPTGPTTSPLAQVPGQVIEEAGDDDGEEELDEPFPGELLVVDEVEGDFYRDAMDIT
ncbi:helix-turn-helix domain-containing protein [Streptosporangium sp. NBC_01469]|uniref:helix-turn-helix domain-containing protein n=1 Tax=Streptosporangium sp. NBC_01469 TaxID=2903898 RepID=UPI002E2A2E74|nr:helix-turn-helix domain-containing protein [Streptosporangium sp. NBC_01469]